MYYVRLHVLALGAGTVIVLRADKVLALRTMCMH